MKFGNQHMSFDAAVENGKRWKIFWLYNVFFFPFTNYLNFRFVPETFKFPMMNTANAIWNVFIAYVNQKQHLSKQVLWIF